jgi:hypothetical protein
MEALETFYAKRLEQFNSELKKVRDKIAVVAVLRLAVFVASALLIYQYLTSKAAVQGLIGLVLLIVFFLLIKYNFRLTDKKNLLTQMLFVNTNEWAVLRHERSSFANGKQFGTGHPFAEDLDIFGEGSLYHLLNRATTSHGHEKLALEFQNTNITKEQIGEKQAAVRALGEQIENRQLLTANGLLHGEAEGNLHDLSGWLKQPAHLHKNLFIRIIRWVLPLINVAIIFYALDSGNTLALAAGIAASWLVIASQLTYINIQHELVSKKQAILDQYAGILGIFSAVDADGSTLLGKLQENVSHAHQAIHKLATLTSAFDQRLNLIVTTVLNSFFLYDIHCVLALERWKEKNRSQFEGWMKTVGEIESLNSFATFAFNNPGFQYPEPGDSGLFIEGKEIAHPLIGGGQRISNSITIGRQSRLLVVTGSNMSGKTTFLRTLGVNLVLAQCGAPVCAASFRFTPMHILSSIRVSDSLLENTSYFMAELKRLHQIVEHLDSGKPALVLIDEILRGTNSDDKTHGSEQFIRKLLSYNCITLFATHDLSLGALATEFPGTVANYCFESTIENGELFFDYKLREGVAKNRNASFLMRKMGIIS